MWITWLVMLRQIPETSISTSVVRKKTPKVFHPWKGRMERVFLSRTSKRQRNSMLSLRMCSIKMSTHRSRFWVGLHLSWMILLVSKDGVIKLLKGLNPSKALRPDELHPRVLKELATELGPVFVHLFQQSIDTGEIPKEWSLANICPLFKKSDRSLACNYRPVSLACVPCKLLEHIVCSNIMAHLDEYKLLSDRQHAFRKGHSCETQLTTVINDWAKILDKEDRLTHSYWILKRHLIHPLMNSLKANCLAMASVARHWNGQIIFFASDNNELL